MAKRLKAFVHVHVDDGETHIYGPEDEVPAEDAKLIGDHAWVDDDEPLPDNRPGVVVDNPGDRQQKPAKKPAPEKVAPAKRPPRKAPAKKAAAKEPDQGDQGAGAGDSGSGSSSGN